ncbi:HET-domain-containing protein, partial [Canariomyces notabilis]
MADHTTDVDKHFVVLRSLPNHTRSPETLALAKRWVADCSQNHEKCRKTTVEGAWSPTRLLDLTRLTEVGRVNDGPEQLLDQTVFLIETANAPPVKRYTTLSHRWGSEEQVKLTKDTYLQLSNGVKLDSLPQLIQDAIFVTVELSVGYLWIDLLCIYQDDVADWQRESSLMQKVYSNCFCNISAGNANGCFESMFNSRDPSMFLPQVIELETRYQHVGEDDIILNRTKTLYRVFEASFWRNNVTNELVNKRAWVFQERFLSPRVLQFGKRLVTWDCLERPAADMFPDGFPEILRHLNRYRYFGGDFKSWRSIDEYGIDSPYILWEHLVRRYSACALTFPGDKLVAFSGVAKHMAGILKDEYVAGMWRRYLEGELLWMVDAGKRKRQILGRQPKPRPVEYRAPSWSWASVDGPVTPGRAPINVESLLIKVEDVHLSYQTGDTTGQVTGGWLRLRGILKELKLVGKILDNGWHVWHMYLDGVKVAILPDDFTAGGALTLDNFEGDFDEEYGNALLFAMCARKTQRSDGLVNRQMFILLFRLVNREKAVFERIGVFETFDEEVETEVLKTQRPADAPPIPCLEFRDGMHTICV